ncbi:MAG: universal stress protein [Bdellovibrionales bacterium]|nr:universal stress protein [Bdellovibrionales bacterium]
MIPRSILVAEDLDNFSEQGQRRGKTVRGLAQDFSRLLHEDLKLVYVEDPKTYPNKNIHNDPYFKTWQIQHERMLKDLAKAVSPKTKFEIRAGSPADEILKAVHQWPRPEMVIMGTQGHVGFERILEGSVAETVLLNSERPVMVAGPHVQEKFVRLRDTKNLKILVATDLSRDSKPAEEYAMSLAARTRAEVTLFHSAYDKIKRVHEASIMSGFANFDLDRIFQKMQRDAIENLAAKRDRMRKSMVDCEFIVADPKKPLNEALMIQAAKNYCLIVLGTHSKRNALLRAFLGSTARDTILQAEIPVVVVHSH